MNSNSAKGMLDEISGKIKEKWGRLTDDDLTTIKGNSKALAGKLRYHYGMAEQDATDQASEFMKHLKSEGCDMSAYLNEGIDKIKDNMNQASEVMVDYIRQKPITSVAIALFAGAVLALLGRR